MPKIIENVQAKLLEEARRQIEERGYKETTVRSVAGALSIGLGTLYNYFDSKDTLVASFMLEDWTKVMNQIRRRLDLDEPPLEKLNFIYDGLLDFAKSHDSIFKDPVARKTFSISTEERHPILLGQISAMVLPLLSGTDVADKNLLADFISESMLTWSMAGREYADLKPIFNKLI
jgi:AcrR family transcriptional regulator